MENKINIAELLKDCPQGMELDCAMYDNCTYAGIEDVGYIDILINTPSGRIRLTKEGCYIRHDDNAKCVIFPKNKTTWEGFVPPCKFKDGDIVTLSNDCGIHTFIYNTTTDGYSYGYYAIITSMDNFKVSGFCSGSNYRLATEEEKQKLFDAIKTNGYRWNAETKTLENLIEPKFKVGDKIVKKKGISVPVEITSVGDDFYYSNTPNSNSVDVLPIQDQNDWELVPTKFDITTLVPFESKVLVRDNEKEKWKPAIWGYYDTDHIKYYPYETICGNCFEFCIPYEGNEHLVGTKNDCDEYYKNW